MPVREALALALTLVGAALLVTAGWVDDPDAVRGLYTTGGVAILLGVLFGTGDR